MKEKIETRIASFPRMDGSYERFVQYQHSNTNWKVYASTPCFNQASAYCELIKQYPFALTFGHRLHTKAIELSFFIDQCWKVFRWVFFPLYVLAFTFRKLVAKARTAKKYRQTPNQQQSKESFAKRNTDKRFQVERRDPVVTFVGRSNRY